MLYREIIAECSEIYTEHILIHTVCVGTAYNFLMSNLVVFIVTTGLKGLPKQNKKFSTLPF